MGVWIMQRMEPTLNRPFRTPLVPLVPDTRHNHLCGNHHFARYPHSDDRARVDGIGLFVYFLYGRNHSKLNAFAFEDVKVH